MDSLIALKGKDFVIIACDTTNAYSVLRMKVPFSLFRTTTIKYGISMAKNSWLSEENTLTSWFSVTTSRKTWLTCTIRTGTNCPLRTLPSLSDLSWPRLSGKDLTASTVSWQVSKATSLDFTGLTTLAQ